MLGNVANLARKLSMAEFGKRTAVDFNAATIGLGQAEQTADQGGFSRAIGTDDGKSFTRADSKAGVIE